jgi:hypothetical protein
MSIQAAFIAAFAGVVPLCPAKGRLSAERHVCFSGVVFFTLVELERRLFWNSGGRWITRMKKGASLVSILAFPNISDDTITAA